MKKQVLMSLLAVIAITVMPGCGKKKNNEAGVIVGGPVGVVQPYGSGTGGCYPVPQYYNSSLTLGFSGSISQSYNGIIASLNLYAASAGFPGGYTNTYYRQNHMTQDRVDLALNGGSAYAQVTLGAGTVALIAQSSNGYSQGEVCGFYINTGIVNPPITSGAWTGHLGGGQIGVVTRTGQFIQL